MKVLVTVLKEGYFYVAEVDASDMATSIQWNNENLQYQLEDHEAWFFRDRAEFPFYPLKEERLIAYLESDSSLKQPADYYYIEGMRAPKKRNKNLRFCVTFEANAEYYTLKESIQDITQYDPSNYLKEFKYVLRNKEPYFVYQRRGTPIYHVKGYEFMFNNGLNVPDNDFINKGLLGL